MDDEARPLGLSERQARTGGRRNVSSIVLDARAQRRANEPTGTSEQSRRADPVGRPGQIGAALVLHHPVQRHRPCDPPAEAHVVTGTCGAVATDDPGFEHEAARWLLRLNLRRQRG